MALKRKRKKCTAFPVRLISFKFSSKKIKKELDSEAVLKSSKITLKKKKQKRNEQSNHCELFLLIAEHDDACS